MFKILVVEDELYARESLMKQIREYDTEGQFRIWQASNGKEGEALFKEHQPELVITDIRMPKMDGLELLERIREEDARAQVVIVSAYSDFEYARLALTYGAVDYLLKPVENEALGQCLDKFVQKNRNEKKEALITGQDIVTQFIANSIRKESYSSFVEESMFRKVYHAYQITAVRFHDKKPERQDFLAKIEGIYGSAFWSQFRFLEMDFDIWALVTVPNQGNSFFWRKLCRLLDEKGYPASMGVSEAYTEAGKIRNAFREAREALKYKIYGEGIYFAEKIKKEPPAVYHISKAKETALLEALRNGNEKGTESIICEIFEEIKEQGMVKAECLEMLYSKVTILFYQAIGENREEGEAFERTHTGILRFSSLDEMEHFLLNINKNICRMKMKTGNGNRKEIVDTLTEYAMEHYNQDISLKELAEKVLFMNQDYLSHLFAEKKGISFSVFLRQIRMEHAKELLERENFSVTEVASMTGYNDTSQFIRFFKQETGMTPKKYRTYVREKEMVKDE
ncbi:response regulator [Parablautia muri]|uniref:Stage 0 sporulation protein A homolog n=1 Tax=Parablautia muri TaxID=2320879 RepID=A0A9X5BIN2_9FIRM|nr:response regulator [Parablautia muri]NBJ94379.1 response regulator [Parablautia muri]